MKNDKAWIGDLLGGPLMSRESRVIAELLLTDPDEQTWQEQIVGHNILQASSPNTAKRYAAINVHALLSSVFRRSLIVA
ncbi:BrxA family protein, partial [Escherichia sp. TWPC-MK]